MPDYVAPCINHSVGAYLDLRLRALGGGAFNRAWGIGGGCAVIKGDEFGAEGFKVGGRVGLGSEYWGLGIQLRYYV